MGSEAQLCGLKPRNSGRGIARPEDFGVEGERRRAYTYGMAKRQQRKTGQKDAVKAAAEFGIDISALKDNLKLSYSERIRRHQIALNTIEKLRKAKFIAKGQ